MDYYAGGGAGGGGGSAYGGLGSFWTGADGNVWVAGPNGTNNAGVWDDNSYSYWTGKGFNQIADPTRENAGMYPVLGASTSTSNATSGGTGTASYTPEEMWLLDQQIGNADSAISRLLSQRQIGESNIENSYNSAETKRQNEFNAAQGQYGQTKQRNLEDYTDTRSSIRQGAGQQMTALQRLLGGQGAGRSSAAQLLAPFAVGREAATRFGQGDKTFGRNTADLDTSWASTEGQYNQYGEELKADRENKRNSLFSGLASAETDLLNQKAGLGLQKAQLQGGGLANVQAAVSPYQSRIQQLLSQIDGYGNLSVAPTKSIAFSKPNMEQYNYSRFSTPTANGQRSGVDDYTSPFVQLLNNREEKDKLKVQ